MFGTPPARVSSCEEYVVIKSLSFRNLISRGEVRIQIETNQSRERNSSVDTLVVPWLELCSG
jgi:hypothetical protein